MTSRSESNTSRDQQPVKARDIAAFSVWCIGILLLTAVPVGVGILVTTMFAEFGAIKPELKPWLVHLAVGIVIGWLILSEIAEFIVKFSVANRHKLTQKILSTSCGFLILLGFFSIIFESILGSLVATITTQLAVLALLPALKNLEKKAPKQAST